MAERFTVAVLLLKDGLPLLSCSSMVWPLSVVTVTTKLPVPDTPSGRMKLNDSGLNPPAASVALPDSVPEAIVVRLLSELIRWTRTESLNAAFTAALPTLLSSQSTVTWLPDWGDAGDCTVRFDTVRLM